MEAQSPNIHILTHNLPLFPALPPLYPLVSSSHLTPSVSQGPIKSPPPPPTPPPLPSSLPRGTPLSSSFSPPLTLSQMSPSFFCSYSQTTAPCRWFNFFSPWPPPPQPAVPARRPKQLMRRPVWACVRQSTKIVYISKLILPDISLLAPPIIVPKSFSAKK